MLSKELWVSNFIGYSVHYLHFPRGYSDLIVPLRDATSGVKKLHATETSLTETSRTVILPVERLFPSSLLKIAEKTYGPMVMSTADSITSYSFPEIWAGCKPIVVRINSTYR